MNKFIVLVCVFFVSLQAHISPELQEFIATNVSDQPHILCIGEDTFEQDIKDCTLHMLKYNADIFFGYESRFDFTDIEEHIMGIEMGILGRDYELILVSDNGSEGAKYYFHCHKQWIIADKIIINHIEREAEAAIFDSLIKEKSCVVHIRLCKDGSMFGMVERILTANNL